MTRVEILVIYYSRHGSTLDLARAVADGVDSVSGCQSRLRTVPAVSANHEATEAAVPDSGPPYAEPQDLKECDGLIIGSPTRFGNMAAAEMDFEESVMSSGFTFNNPNQTDACGCGESVTIVPAAAPETLRK